MSEHCPICKGKWTNLLELWGIVYFWHNCPVAKCYIGWKPDEQIPLTIPDEYIYRNPPRHLNEEEQ